MTSTGTFGNQHECLSPIESSLEGMALFRRLLPSCHSCTSEAVPHWVLQPSLSDPQGLGDVPPLCFPCVMGQGGGRFPVGLQPGAVVPKMSCMGA